MADESPPKLITEETCRQCGYRRTRDEEEGDFVFKHTTLCPNCQSTLEISSIYVEPSPRKIRTRNATFIILALTIFFFALSYSRLGEIPYQYFDEPDYIGGGVALARLMLPPPQFVDGHPPLAKIIIGVGVLLFGQNPIGWRLMEAVFATITIPLLYLFSRKIFGSGLIALLPPLLLTFDFMHFVLAKLAILDSIFGFFALLMQIAFYGYYRYAQQHQYAHSTKRLAFAGITTGLATAAKWPAAFSLVGFAVVFLYLTWRRHQQSHADRKIWLRTTLRPVIIALLCLLLAALVYLLTWLPYMVAGWSINLTLYWQTLLYQYHLTHYGPYAYDSRFWSWPLMLTPIPMIFQNNTQVAEILVMGNPAVWWATYPILAASIMQVLRKHDEKLAYLLVSFLSSWLPFALLNRFQIIYYFYVSIPLLILLTTYWLRLAMPRRTGKIAVAAYLITVVALFALFYPLLTAEPVFRQLAESLRWLPSWGP